MAQARPWRSRKKISRCNLEGGWADSDVPRRILRTKMLTVYNLK